MPTLVWDETGKRFYETGVNKCALYVQSSTGTYPEGVAWNGITAVNESPSGAEANPIYADNMKYLTLMSAEELGLSIEAYTYPDEFAVCDGSSELNLGVSVGQQPRKAFGLSYKTLIGNDIDNNDHGYKLHLVYGCMAAPSEKGYSTINDSPEAITMSWEVTTTPLAIPNHSPSAQIIIDSTKIAADKLAALEAILYGTGEVKARLPLPEEVITLTTVTP